MRPINTIITEDVSTRTDPQLETLTTPILLQELSHPQTIESTSNETSLGNLNQDRTDTVTHGFNPHAGPTSSSTPTKPDNWDSMTKQQRRYWYKHKLG